MSDQKKELPDREEAKNEGLSRIETIRGQLKELDEEYEFEQKLEGFLKRLNQSLNEQKEIKKRQGAGGKKFDYIPVSIIQAKLDAFFFGRWTTHGFQWGVIANEVVGSIELSLFHPFSQEWITRVGAGAVQIQQSKDANITDMNAKFKNTLEMGISRLKADCLKNAAKDLGTYFGRDLNRDYAEQYVPLIHAKKDKLQQLLDQEEESDE